MKTMLKKYLQAELNKRIVFYIPAAVVFASPSDSISELTFKMDRRSILKLTVN